MNDETTNAAINNKFFTRLGHINYQLCKVELAKSEIKQKEPNTVGFFILQNAVLRMLELYYNFFEKFCDTGNYDEKEFDTDSLFLALAEKKIVRLCTKWENARVGTFTQQKV